MAEENTQDELVSWTDGPDQDLYGWLRAGDQAQPAYHFLHGNGFCSRTLWPVARLLPGNAPLIFTDVPGHGFSPQPQHHMPDWLRIARRVTPALERLSGARPVVGIGHSMGGVLTLLMAAERPQLFSRIILLDPVLFSPEVLLYQKLTRKTGLWKRSALVKAVSNRRALWPDAETMKADLKNKSLYRQWTEAALDNFITGGSRAVEEGRQLCCDPHWEAAIFGSYPRGLWQAVHRVSVPVDILVADESYGFIVRSARKAAKANRNIRWQSVKGGHCFPMEQPQLAADLISALIGGSVN